MDYETQTLNQELHNALLDWQKKNFLDFPYLLQHWSRFYPDEAPFQLLAKIGPIKSPLIEYGKLKGREKFKKAREMDEEMVFKAGKIIKAQCSTELGSIQQHAGSLHKAQDETIQFDVLRVMGEEFRHAYQMLFVLANDDWGKTGRDLARDLVEELLTMKTGTHVLDAFNLYFDSFVDNIVFAALIDRVGKYQLLMQQHFSYEPMARSMGPMLQEEAFHLTTGVLPMKKWAREAALGTGNVTLKNLQKHINKWLPRGLEMFGNEQGGQDIVELSFKNWTNKEAQDRYYQEIKEGVIDTLNAEIVKARLPKLELDTQKALAVTSQILETGNSYEGICPEDLIRMPDIKFFRRRGSPAAYEMYDLQGHKQHTLERYLQDLRGQLPEAYVTGPDFKTYAEGLHQHHLQGITVSDAPLPFYG